MLLRIALIVCFIRFLISSTGVNAQDRQQPPPNILLIIVDDLRPELGCYGNPVIQSPNIDRLAAEGMLFHNAYCNFPVCGASRASFLTGLRPARNRFLLYNTYAEKDAPQAMPLPAYFRQNGYTTLSNGKVFHNKDDHAAAWDKIWRPDTPGNWLDYQTPANQALVKGGSRGMAYEQTNVPDDAYFDGKIAAQTIADLKELRAQEKPFLLAVGFLKPHLPFNAPQQYWDLYAGKVKQPENNYVPQNAPPISIHNSGELRNYHGIPRQGPVADSTALKLIQGYYACISYVDAQIGKVLQAVKELGMAENTLIVLMSDHGYNLQEHTMWCKHCNYKNSLRSTLIVKDPRVKKPGQTQALVEFVDVFPTLADAAGLPPLPQLEGKSFLPLLQNPNQKWKPFVIAKHDNAVTIKTLYEAYTEWIGPAAPNRRMLYDHRRDPEENENISELPQHKKRVRKLSELLKNNWGKDF